MTFHILEILSPDALQLGEHSNTNSSKPCFIVSDKDEITFNITTTGNISIELIKSFLV